MEISAKVLADSLSPCGARLTTMEWTYPRCIHSEIMTHRMLSKNAASSRAIPIDKMIARIREYPFIPKVWGTHQSGMQAGAELDEAARQVAIDQWLDARDSAVRYAEGLQRLKLAKQIVNRVYEPWMFITIIVSATSWENVWGLRCHKDAEPHFQELAYKARNAMDASTPRVLGAGDWHLPLVDVIGRGSDSDWGSARNLLFADQTFRIGSDETKDALRRIEEVLRKVSVGRCARVSYLTHDGKRDLQADIDLHDRLIVQQPAHASPAEHVAQALDWPKWFANPTHRLNDPTLGPTVYYLRDQVVHARRVRMQSGAAPSESELRHATALGELTSGNFLGFQQYRKTLENEHIGGLMP